MLKVKSQYTLKSSDTYPTFLQRAPRALTRRMEPGEWIYYLFAEMTRAERLYTRQTPLGVPSYISG